MHRALEREAVRLGQLLRQLVCRNLSGWYLHLDMHADKTCNSSYSMYNKSMYTVIETNEFIAWSANIWSDAERGEFIDFISQNPLAGDVIPGAGSLRKVRWSRAGMGKQGGARVIYFNRLANGEIVLLLVYAKAKFDNIRPEVLLKIKEKFDAQ